ALTLAMVGCAIVGYLIEKLAYRPLRGSPRINILITAVGVSLFLQYSGQLVFGSSPQFFPELYKSATEGGVWSFGKLKINPLQVIVLGISVTLMLALQYIIFRTR